MIFSTLTDIEARLMSQEPERTEKEAQIAEPKSHGGPYGITFPPDRNVWNESKKLAIQNARVDDLATCASQDPIIVIEFLKTANALYFSGGKQAITSTKTAIVRLGSEVVIDTLDKMAEREDITDEGISLWLETHRSRSKRTSIICRMLAEVASKTLADECSVAGLLSCIGDMLAVVHLGEEYVHLAEENSRSGVLYRLVQDFKLNVDSLGINYLTRQGIPQLLISAIDRDSAIKAADKAIMKPIVSAALEMTEAFDTNRWEKLAPGRNLPPRSSLRLLQFNETAYIRLYERATQYLFAMRSEDEQKKGVADPDFGATSTPYVVPVSETPPSTENTSLSSLNLESELQDLLASRDEDDFESLLNFEPLKEEIPIPAPPLPQPIPQRTSADLRSRKAGEVVSSISSVIDAASTSEELLSTLLTQLVDNGPFEKSALIVVSKDGKNAMVIAARGPNIGSGQKISITDALSPLSQSFSKVQSFGRGSSATSPFGSSTYAVAPIEAEHETPVALYADCGNHGTISFEARRVFRNVVELLNQKLPTLPGGLPMENGKKDRL